MADRHGSKGAAQQEFIELCDKALVQLNAEQLAAATCLDGFVKVEAGPGTGKTHMLIGRTGALLKAGKQPETVAAMSFTRTSGSQLSDRMTKAFGEPGSRVHCSTICSFFLKSLRDFRLEFHFPFYRILDDSEDTSLVRRLYTLMLNELDEDYQEQGDSAYCAWKKEKANYPKVSELVGTFRFAANSMTDLEDLINLNSPMGRHIDFITDLHARYTAEKKKNGYLTFDDVISETIHWMKVNPAFRHKLCSKYSYLMVDEYQDTNRLQATAIDILASECENLCVVGDSLQAIYAFRAASVFNLIGFEERHPSAKTFVLLQNYRSSQQILNLANAVAAYVEEGESKYLLGQFQGPRPQLIQTSSARSEAEWIVRKIRENTANGIPYSEQAVLIRNSDASTFLEQRLTQEGIPFVKRGGRTFMQKKHVQVLLQFLILSVREKDEFALSGILELLPKMGPKSIETIISLVKIHGIEVLLYPNQYLSGVKQGKQMIASLEGFSDFWFPFIDAPTVSERIRLAGVYYESLLNSYLTRTGSSNKEMETHHLLSALKEDIPVFMSLANLYVDTQLFLDTQRMDTVMRQDDVDELVISTIHQAKGLEWRAVYLMQPAEGVFMHNVGNFSEKEEARRLLYVALTRAKELLYLTLPHTVLIRGEQVENQLSSFLRYDDVMACLDVINDFQGYGGDYFEENRSRRYGGYDRYRRRGGYYYR